MLWRNGRQPRGLEGGSRKQGQPSGVTCPRAGAERRTAVCWGWRSLWARAPRSLWMTHLTLSQRHEEGAAAVATSRAGRARVKGSLRGLGSRSSHCRQSCGKGFPGGFCGCGKVHAPRVQWGARHRRSSPSSGWLLTSVLGPPAPRVRAPASTTLRLPVRIGPPCRRGSSLRTRTTCFSPVPTPGMVQCRPSATSESQMTRGTRSSQP